MAGILGHVDVGCLPQQALVLDVRRHDERTLYGSIPGSRTVMSPSAPLHASRQHKRKHLILHITSAEQELYIYQSTSSQLLFRWHLRPGRTPSIFPGPVLEIGSSCSVVQISEQPGLLSWQQMQVFNVASYINRCDSASCIHDAQYILCGQSGMDM